MPASTQPSTPSLSPPARQPAAALVIGYGNVLRGDDGLGPTVATLVQEWNHPRVAAIACHQLTPELAATIARHKLVIFVDAERTGRAGPVREQPIRPAAFEAIDPHTSSPQGLLALAHALFGACPPAWLLTIPGADFGFGEKLSAPASQGVAAALRQLRQRLGLSMD